MNELNQEKTDVEKEGDCPTSCGCTTAELCGEKTPENSNKADISAFGSAACHVDEQAQEIVSCGLQNKTESFSASGCKVTTSKQSPGFFPVFLILFIFLSLSLGFSVSRKGFIPAETTAQSSQEVSISSFFEGFSDDTREGIAVVKLYGVIQTESEHGVFASPSGSDMVVEQLKKIAEDKRVKAVVLRINSPGGTVGASQEIWQEVGKLRSKGIKVVASMADVCASGGVYVAVASDKIVANKGTITGSVGVIFSVQNLKGLMDKVGVSTNSIRSGKFKDIGSYAREMTDEERLLLQGIVNSTYEQFLQAVVDGRGLDKEKVKEWADGRIFNGVQALQYGLIDKLGSFQDALELAKELAGLKEAHIVKQRVNPMDRFEILFGNFFNPVGNLKGEVKKMLPFTHSPVLYYYDGGM